MLSRIFSGRRAISTIIAGVLYMGIIVSAVAITLQYAKPTLEQIRDSATIDEAQDSLQKFDKAINDVISEGKGSRRVLTLTVTNGEYKIEGDKKSVSFELETEANLVEPGYTVKQGNIEMSANAEVDAYDNGANYVLENRYLRVLFNKINGTSYNNSFVVNTIVQKRNNVSLPFAAIPVTIDNDPTTMYGTGYTGMEPGYGLATGSVVAHMDSPTLAYDIYYDLRSEADFLTIRVENMTAVG